MKLSFKFRPRLGQLQIMKSLAKFRIAVAHRRFGKTYVALAELILDGLNALRDDKDKVVMAYIAPTFGQAKRIAWEALKKLTSNFPDKEGWFVKYNEAELRFEFGQEGVNKFTIYLLGSENYDSLRGIGLYRVVLDEFGDMNSKVWTEVIYPTTLDTEDSRVTFIGTPKGRNKFYELFEAAKDNPLWDRFKFDIHSSGVFSEAQIDEIKTQYKDNPEAFSQEFLLSWEPSVQGAIYLQQIVAAKNSGRVGDFPYDPRVTVTTAWDIGVNDDTSILFVQQVGAEIRIVDCYSNNNLGMDHYINYVKDWAMNHNAVYDKHLGPHDLKVREFTSGKSRYETARNLGLTFTIVKKLSIEDGINAGRQLLPRCFFHEPMVHRFIESLSQYRREYDDKKEIYKAKPVHDKHSHWADAFKYLAIGEKVIDKNKFGTDADPQDWNPY